MTQGGGDPAAVEALRRLAGELLAKGLDRSSILADLVRARDRHGPTVPDAELLALLDKLPRLSLDVNQEIPKPRRTKRTVESHGEAGRAAAKNAATQPVTPRTAEETFLQELKSNTPSSLTLEQYLCAAVREHWRWKEADREGWQSDLFYFVRLVKGHPAMRKLTAPQALAAVEKQLARWSKAQPDPAAADPWARWLHVPAEDARFELLDAWDKVRHLPGYSPLDDAIERHWLCPLRLTPDVLARRTEVYQTFVSIAGWLQVVKVPTPLDVGKRAWFKMSPAERTEFLAWLYTPEANPEAPQGTP